MANIDINDTNKTSTYEEPIAYANILIPEETDEGTEWSQIGKYGVNLLASRELDMALLELAEECPEAIEELEIRMVIKRSKAKKRDGKPKIKIGTVK